MHQAPWIDDVKHPRFLPLQRDLAVDVAVIGGGITGLTTALLLKRAGLSVAVLERDRCGDGESGRTTAHLTMVTDQRLHALARRLGDDHARAVWEAGDAALEQVRGIVCSNSIDCDLHTAPVFLHASLEIDRPNDRRDLMREAQTIRRLGFDADFIDDVPFMRRCGVRIPHQALIHPLKYLFALAQQVDGDGSRVFEHSEVKSVEDGSIVVNANGRQVRCEHLVIATHVPMMGKSSLIKATFLQTRIYPYSSYVLGARLAGTQTASASFFDTSDPYYYMRIDQRGDDGYVIFGGKDHKTGQPRHAAARFAALKRLLRTMLPDARVESQWSGQVIETHDGLPFIGQTAERQYVATGFVGNGMTFGTLAAMIITDAIQGRRNPWADLFDVQRKRVRGAWNYVRENLDYPYYMIRDRMQRSESRTTRSVKRGQGMILRVNGRRVAAYRNQDGALSMLSSVCTHMGCLVRWNDAERTWDCPCHGSRFHPHGRVLAGPAEQPLATVKRTEPAG